jgi:lipopolysaccharide biosynthesis protein
MRNRKPVNSREHRRDIITGLRQLADALDANHDLPVPHVVDINYYPRNRSDAANLAEILRIARLLGVKARIDRDAEHFRAVQRFSGVVYRAVAITQQAKTRWKEMQTARAATQPQIAAGSAKPNAHR